MSTPVPIEVTPPGEFIRDEIEARGWTQETLAEVLGKSVRLVNEIMTSRRSITPETAAALAQAFGTSAEMWLNLESAYQLSKIAIKHDAIARRAALYSAAPVRDMIKRRWIERSDSIDVLEGRVLNFYEAKAIDGLEAPAHAARKSTSYESATPEVCAWLRMARRMAKSVHAGAFSTSKLRSAMSTLRRFLKSAEEVRHVPRVLADAGIRFVVVEHLPHSKIDGAALWIDKHPVVALSLRYDRLDYFWFTLAHELFHVLHGDGASDDSEYRGYDSDLVGQSAAPDADLPPLEIERNSEAADFLIPKSDLDDFVLRVGPLYSKKRIIGFAEVKQVHPALVVGQLQNRREIHWTHNREMLVRVREHITDSALTDGWGHYAAASL